jgi:hypothetical protein
MGKKERVKDAIVCSRREFGRGVGLETGMPADLNGSSVGIDTHPVAL